MVNWDSFIGDSQISQGLKLLGLSLSGPSISLPAVGAPFRPIMLFSAKKTTGVLDYFTSVDGGWKEKLGASECMGRKEKLKIFKKFYGEEREIEEIQNVYGGCLMIVWIYLPICVLVRMLFATG